MTLTNVCITPSEQQGISFCYRLYSAGASEGGRPTAISNGVNQGKNTATHPQPSLATYTTDGHKWREGGNLLNLRNEQSALANLERNFIFGLPKYIPKHCILFEPLG